MRYSDTELNPSSAVDLDEVRLLDETGKTIIYVFPSGYRFATYESPDFDEFADNLSEPPKVDNPLLERLIAEGKLDAARKAIVLNDQKVTGWNLGEILVARCWVS
ncbi:MAG: hypothetical protein ACFBSG_05565 [Leptolyngbyaceae cyanobacterium]